MVHPVSESPPLAAPTRMASPSLTSSLRAPAAARIPSGQGPEGDALLGEVRGSLGTLGSLLAHEKDLGPDVLAAVRSTVTYAEARLARQELSVVMVGERGAGTTTFLDALLGERLLGRAPRGHRSIIFIRRGALPTYRARFGARGNVEDFDKKVPDRTAELTEALEAAEEELAAALAEKDGVAAEGSRKSERHASAQSALTERFQAFEEARDRAASIGKELADAEARAAELDQKRLEG